MKYRIERKEVMGGLIMKKREYEVSTKIQTTDEERTLLNLTHDESSELFTYSYPRSGKDPKNLFVSTWTVLEGGTRHTLPDLAHANLYMGKMQSALTNLKEYITTHATFPAVIEEEL